MAGRSRLNPQEREPANRLTIMSKQSVYIPVSDNGGGSGKTGWAVDMMSAIADGAFNGRFIKIDELSGSHADRACNNMANRFLRTVCDLILIIDIDTRLRPSDVTRILAHMDSGARAVWGTYPKKQENPPPCLNTWPEIPPPDEFGRVNVRRSGRGFLCVAREVFERLKEDNGGPALRFHNHDEIEWSFFRSGVVTGERSAMVGDKDKDGYPIREWITEDWMFCEDIRIHLGIPTLVDTGIVLKHVGEKVYEFPAESLVRVDSNIKIWRDIHGWFDYEDFYRWLVEEIPAGGKFVEVGCWLGRSIAALHSFAQEAGKTLELSVVDTFQGKPANEQHRAILAQHGGNVMKAFMANTDALKVPMTIYPKGSPESASQFSDQSLDAVFIDGDHSYEAVRADIEAWLPKVKPRGILSGHDYDMQTDPDVVRVVNNYFDGGAEVQVMGRCWYVRL